MADYNTRLFSKGFRGWLHNSRFLWFKETARRLFAHPVRAVELGCFDGRLLGYFPKPPVQYEGFDANWEGGLASAKRRFTDLGHWRFHKAEVPSDLSWLPDRHFEVAVSLETLEHVPPAMVDGYLAELARVTEGYLLVSVPNEKGLVFIVKYLGKKLIYGGGEKYRLKEVVAATLGRTDKVERRDHKGFDWANLVQEIGRHFEVTEVGALPVRWLPPSFAFTVAIVARSRPEPEIGTDRGAHPGVAP